MIIDLIRRPDLLKASVVHHSDRIRHVDGFFLIVSDIDKGDPQLLLQALQLVLHGTPQLQIQCRSWRSHGLDQGNRNRTDPKKRAAADVAFL